MEHHYKKYEKVARAHGVEPELVQFLGRGAINAVYRLGESLVLRVPDQTDHAIRQCLTEAIAIPLATDAGIRTPALVKFDKTCRLINVPYIVTTYVPGIALGSISGHESLSHVYDVLIDELARLHEQTVTNESCSAMVSPTRDDVRTQLALLAHEGWLGSHQIRWFADWLDLLSTKLAVSICRFLHADAHPLNVLTNAEGNYEALVDWGDAGWGDPALEFRCLPMNQLERAVERYRMIMPVDDGFESRILWDHITIAIQHIRNVPSDDALPWRSQPFSKITDLMRFCIEARDTRWQSLIPRRNHPKIRDLLIPSRSI